MQLAKAFDSIRGWIDVRTFQARAACLTDLWELSWPVASPLGHELRVAYVDRWVRFHSLPE